MPVLWRDPPSAKSLIALSSTLALDLPSAPSARSAVKLVLTPAFPDKVAPQSAVLRAPDAHITREALQIRSLARSNLIKPRHDDWPLSTQSQGCRLAKTATSPRQAAAAPAPAPAAAATASPAAAAASHTAASAASHAAASDTAASDIAASGAAAASGTAAASAVSAAAASAACSDSNLYAWPGVSEVFCFEKMERREADVRDLLVTESGELKRRRILPEYMYRPDSRRRERRRRYIRWRPAGRRCQRHPRNS